MNNLQEYGTLELTSEELKFIDGGIIPILIILMFAAGATAAVATK